MMVAGMVEKKVGSSVVLTAEPMVVSSVAHSAES